MTGITTGVRSGSRVLLTGASGYIGGRLLPALIARGHEVRCLARQSSFLASRLPPGVEVVEGDVRDPRAMAAALHSIDAAYYLVHSMGEHGDFESRDRECAEVFGEACRQQGVRRIVYLGGLGEDRAALSSHLRSRLEVGDLLRRSGVPVVELRAGIVIGSGSLSFELLRALVEKLPVMVTPRWTSNATQPIGIEDMVTALVRSLEIEIPSTGDILEVGTAEPWSYARLMQEYARQRGLRRWMIPVPFLTPWLSSLWLGLVTPVYARIGRRLVDSLRHPMLLHDGTGLARLQLTPVGVREAIERALSNEDQQFASSRWSDAISSGAGHRTWAGVRFGTRLVDHRQAVVPRPADTVFSAVQSIGGSRGYYYGNWLWRLRGWIDLIAGGVGMRRGRRSPDSIVVGDVIDCWRVEDLAPGRRLRLQAEMCMPGRGWLEFEVEPSAEGAVLRQSAIFDPVGLAGLVYWFSIWPLHQLVFDGMLRGLARASDPQTQERRTRLGRARGAWILLTLACLGAGGLVGAATAPAIRDWYPTLVHPGFTPPSDVFGPAWTVLYIMMATAAWRVWRTVSLREDPAPYRWFCIQMFLNLLWSLLFFGLRSPGLALIDIALLIPAVWRTMHHFGRYSAFSLFLMIPYLAWICFAFMLNAAFFWLNI